MPGDDVLADWRATLLSNGHDLPVLSCAGGRVQAANRAAAELFGESSEGADVLSYFQPASRDKLAATLARPCPADVIELQVARWSELPKAVRFVLLPDPAHGSLLVACSSSRGRTDEPSAKLLEANDRLVGLARSLSRSVRDSQAEREALVQLGNLRELFVAAMAHDLKSPLQAIVLSEALLKDSAKSGAIFDMHRHAARVEHQAQRMLELIDSLLLAARLDSTEPGLPTEPLDVCSLAAEMAVAFEGQAQEAETKIELVCGGAARVRGNRVWLGEVFANLLSNAVRHSPRAGRIALTTRPEGDRVVCSVGDQGPGVPEAARETVFDRYVQYGESKGTAGLGLYICKRVVELHGGRIWVESAPGSGARFVFELPALAL